MLQDARDRSRAARRGERAVRHRARDASTLTTVTSAGPATADAGSAETRPQLLHGSRPFLYALPFVFTVFERDFGFSSASVRAAQTALPPDSHAVPRGRARVFSRGTLHLMAVPDVQKLLALDLQTRLELVQQLWDSIIADANTEAELPLSADERVLLDERLREDDENPDAAIPWAEVKARLRKQSFAEPAAPRAGRDRGGSKEVRPCRAWQDLPRGDLDRDRRDSGEAASRSSSRSSIGTWDPTVDSTTLTNRAEPAERSPDSDHAALHVRRGNHAPEPRIVRVGTTVAHHEQ